MYNYFFYCVVSIFIKPRYMTTQAEQEASSQETFAEKVTSALKAANRDNAGKLTFAEDTPEDVAFAANSERRLRDTQAAYTKGQQSQRALEAENEELLKHISGNVPIKLTQEQREELDDLKISDPDTWYEKREALKAQAQSEQAKEVSERIKTVSAEGSKAVQIEQRSKALREFQRLNPGIVMNDDTIANDLPPRFLKKLDNNEVTFDEFLQESLDYLQKEKVVGDGEHPLGHPNLSKAGGTDNPANYATDKTARDSYENDIY